MTRDIVDVAAAGTVAAALALVLLVLPATAATTADPRPSLPATALLLAVCLPIYLRHIVFAVRDAVPPAAAASAAVLSLLTIGATPLLGAAWLNAVHIVAVVVVLTFRPLFALPAALLLVAATAPSASLLGASWPEALWLSVTTGMRVLAVYTLVWLVVALRRLRIAGATLAERAVARERLRIDRELTRTVQHALIAINAAAGRADQRIARGDRASTRAELEGLVDISRRGLADARQLIRSFQHPTFRNEIASAATLLAAAGIDARVELPDVALPEESLRASLRIVLAQLLRDGAKGPHVIAVRWAEGDWVLACTADAGART